MSDKINEKPARHPKLLEMIKEARAPMKYHGKGEWTDNQLLASYALAVVKGGYHHLDKIKECGSSGVVTNFFGDVSTFDFNEMTLLVLVAHQMGVRISVGSSGPRMIKVTAHARYTSDDKTGELRFSERHPSLDHLAQLCADWKLSAEEVKP